MSIAAIIPSLSIRNSETVQKNASSYHNKGNFDKDRKCWECHKYVPHGKVRSLISTPYSLGIKEHLK